MFFELVIGISGLGGAFRGFGLPLGLILLGVFLFARHALGARIPWLGDQPTGDATRPRSRADQGDGDV